MLVAQCNEKSSKKTIEELSGRNSQNKVIIFPKENYKAGQYVNVFVESANKAMLKGKAIELVNEYKVCNKIEIIKVQS